MKKWIILICVIFVIILILYILFAPGNKKKCVSFSWLFERKIAHRGDYNFSAFINENSESAFKRAIEHRYHIETDLWLTKDNQIVVFHDQNLKRIFNIDRNINEMTLSELKELNYPHSDEKILLLSELLEIVNGKVGLLLEIKDQNSRWKNILLSDKIMKLLSKYQGPYAIQSFNPYILRYFKKEYPFVARGQLYTKFNLNEEKKKMKGAGFKGVIEFIAKVFYNVRFTQYVGRAHFHSQDIRSFSWINRLYRLIMPVIVFTVNDAKQYQYYLKNADNIIFEGLHFDRYGRVK